MPQIKQDFRKVGPRKCHRCKCLVKTNVSERKDSDKPIYCYQCYRVVEYTTRGHGINMRPRQKRVLAGAPVKNYA